jgi:hypothetical protein
MMARKVLFVILFSISFQIQSFSQIESKAIVSGEFLDDTLKIGYPVKFALSIQYPSEWQIFFPDSSSFFGSFEYYDKLIFDTKTVDSISTDSVIYEIMSFDLDSIQKLSLPIFRLFRGDTIEMESNVDSIALKELVTVVPQELDLKENSILRFIPDIFNKKLLLIVLGIVIVILGLVGLLFGKKIITKWKVYRMSQRHKKFVEKFELNIEESRNNPEKSRIEIAAGFWKNYLSELESIPYNTFSTKDFINHLKNEQLIISLKKIDAFVYGGYEEEKLTDSLIDLKQFAEDRFEKMKEEVGNA